MVILFSIMKYSAVLLCILTIGILSVTAISETASAATGDSYFFYGTWEYEETDDYGEATGEVTFSTGDEFEYTWTFTSIDGDSISETYEGKWKIEDDELFLKFEDSEDWDDGAEYEFNGLHTEVTLGEGDDEITWTKQGSVCGACCPFIFMIIGVAAVAQLVLMVIKKKGFLRRV